MTAAVEVRATPLGATLRREIAEHGPLSVHDYMARCLADPAHGYYRTRAAIGAAGDFITAPEISQTFGELIGAWAVVVWETLGRPRAFRLVELGPGRGTLLRDALRAARLRPQFLAGASVHLVELSPVLRAEQRTTLADAGVAIAWCDALDMVPADAPAIVIGNEFLDALPVHQFVRRGAAWRERAVGLDRAGALSFREREPGPAARPLLAALARIATARDGDIAELRDHAPLAAALARFAGAGLAALFFDYGYEGPLVGDTLQAVRRHRHVAPLADPGAADLTAYVDFARAAEALAAAGLACRPLVTQATFLARLGIVERASRLMARNPGEAGAIESAVARLVSPNGMGQRFKVLGVSSPGLTGLPGFGQNEQSDP